MYQPKKDPKIYVQIQESVASLLSVAEKTGNHELMAQALLIATNHNLEVAVNRASKQSTFLGSAAFFAGLVAIAVAIVGQTWWLLVVALGVFIIAVLTGLGVSRIR